MTRTQAADLARKLAVRTTANGCTEDEAAQALAKLQALRLEHELSEGDLKNPEIKCLPGEFACMEDDFEDWRRCLVAVQDLCHLRSYYRKSHEDDLGIGIPVAMLKVKFFGFPLDVQMGIAMCEIVVGALNAQTTMYGETLRAKRSKRKVALQSFRIGMAERLAERIVEITPRPPQGSTGNNLIVLKDQLVNDQWAQYLRDAGLKLGSGRPDNQAQDQAAASAGRARANGVGLQYERPIGQQHLRIGRG